MTQPSFAVVIPAHNEESVIERCLGFAADLEPGEAEIVVVANGCQDGTAAAAARTPGVTVLELDTAGKAEALNAGDRASTAFPRIYLDADIDVDAGALRRMRDALALDEPRVCAPAVAFRTEGRPWAVRAYYRVYAALPYVQEDLVGLGIYGVSRSGRSRFEDFPKLTNDDTYVQRLFGPDERLALGADRFYVHTPRTLASLLAVRVRVTAGNAELAGLGDDSFARSGGDTARALLRLLLRRPWMVLDGGVFLGVTVLSRVLARGLARRRAKGAPGARDVNGSATAALDELLSVVWR